MKLIIGDRTEYLADYSKSIDPDAYLIEKSNFANVHTGVAYTSLADIDKNQFLYLIAFSADDVEYYPPDNWSTDELKFNTERELVRASSWQKIKGIDLIRKPKDLAFLTMDDRKTEKKQLWCAGCSITFGYGVNEGESWPWIISEKSKLKMSLLSYPGGSIRWASDQILRSDVRKDDLVIWGLTSTYRFPCYQSEYTIHAVGEDAFKRHEKIRKYYNIDLVLDHDVLVNESIIGIQSVANFCNNIGAKLLLVGFLDHDDIIPYIGDEIDYVDFNMPPEKYLDLGNDGLHPGPKQHQKYAERIIEWIHTQF